MASLLSRNVERLVQAIDVLIVDDNQLMRKVVRNLLTNVGVRTIYEASDGVAGLEAIRTFVPDIVILDWEMPLLDGGEVARIIRSPGVFPVPDVPIIMLSGHVERWRVEQAQRLGINEFLKKPVSGKALLDRMVAILAHPRPMVRLGDYYGPQPRRPDYAPLRRAACASVSRAPWARRMRAGEHCPRLRLLLRCRSNDSWSGRMADEVQTTQTTEDRTAR